MNQKLLVRVLLGVLAVLLLAGMVVTFTPSLNSFRASRGTPALKVAGETITAQQLDQARQGNPVLSQTQSGVLGVDFKTYLVYQQVQQALLKQAASDVKVGRSEVAAQVKQIRDSQGLAKNSDWLAFLQRAGYTDASARAQIRDGLAVQQKLKQIADAAPKPTDAEVRLYYDLNPDAFKSEARIVAREIVVQSAKKAADLLAQVKGGADFAKLASANSLENKDRGGALGPIENGQPRAVPAVALPQEVSPAAFALTSGGLTDVIKSGDRYYIVKVDKVVPAGTQPFAQAKAQASKAVAAQKKNAAIERWVDGLQKNADVQVLDQNWAYYNPTAATVAGKNIPYAEVIASMLGNKQFGQFLQQGGEQATTLVNSLFKPQILEGLIQSYAAPTIAANLKLPLAGSRQEQLAELRAYGARDVQVTDAEIAQAYQQQKSQFSTPASATVSEATFGDKQRALEFRTDFIKSGGDFTKAASKAGGTVAERGKVQAGDQKLTGASEKAAFSGRLTAAGDGSLSEVTEQGSRYSVLYVTDLVKASAKPLSEVQGQIRTQLIAQKRDQAGQQFVAAQLRPIKVQNDLKSAIAGAEKRAAASAPKPATGTGAVIPPATAPKNGK